MVQLITCEIALCQYVCELVFGVNIFDLDFWVQVDSVKQQFKRDSVDSGHVSHCRASVLDHHLDHRFIILENCKARRKNEKSSRSRKHNRHWITQDHCGEFEY